jgi:hypothetical protein
MASTHLNISKLITNLQINIHSHPRHSVMVHTMHGYHRAAIPHTSGSGNEM